MVNPVQLCRRSERDRIDDRRSVPGGPPRVGDQATLAFRSDHNLPGIAKFEYLTVEVTSIDGETFRGEVDCNTHPVFASRRVLRIGCPIEFCLEHVFAMYPYRIPRGNPEGD